MFNRSPYNRSRFNGPGGLLATALRFVARLNAVAGFRRLN